MESVPADTPIARYIRTHRETAGLTQTQLAAKVGCGQAAVSLWELGARVPSATWLPALAAALPKAKLMEMVDRIANPERFTDNDDDPVEAAS